MPIYKVVVKESLRVTYTVEAVSPEQAAKFATDAAKGDYSYIITSEEQQGGYEVLDIEKHCEVDEYDGPVDGGK